MFSAEEMAVPVPESFDSAAKWPECKTILQIREPERVRFVLGDCCCGGDERPLLHRRHRQGP